MYERITCCILASARIFVEIEDQVSRTIPTILPLPAPLRIHTSYLVLLFSPEPELEQDAAVGIRFPLLAVFVSRV